MERWIKIWEINWGIANFILNRCITCKKINRCGLIKVLIKLGVELMESFTEVENEDFDWELIRE